YDVTLQAWRKTLVGRRRGRLLAYVGNQDCHFAPLDDRDVVELDVEHQRVDVVGPRLEDVVLGAALAADFEEGGAVLEVVVADDGFGEEPARLHRVAVARANYPDAALGHANTLDRPNMEQVGVNSVFAGREDVDLRALLAAVAQEGLAILEAVVTVDVAGKDP